MFLEGKVQWVFYRGLRINIEDIIQIALILIAVYYIYKNFHDVSCED